MADWLGSAVIAALVSAFVATWTTVRSLESKNVIEERAKWRDKMRDLVAEVVSLEEQNCGLKMRRILADFESRLNPRDAADREIVDCIYENIDGFQTKAARAKIQALVAALLKDDWERAKSESQRWLPRIFPFVGPERGRALHCEVKRRIKKFEDEAAKPAS